MEIVLAERIETGQAAIVTIICLGPPGCRAQNRIAPMCWKAA
jgi:hypothetical protein